MAEIPSVQYLSGMEPQSLQEINNAIATFKYKVKMKEGDGVVVNEYGRHMRGTKEPYAHRYRVTFYLEDDKAQWPRGTGDFLTKDEVIRLLDNLPPIWNMIKTHRVKKAIETSKRIKHLNQVAAVDAAKIAKW